MYSENKAFIIKEKKGKDIKYKNITYKEFKKQMNSLGTALVDLGLKDKRVAIISKNRYGQSDIQIVSEADFSINYYEDKGYCIVPQDY